uniref:AlNc14C300G10368 protein n=1 Tax=Albugo laibachii Nc14 TaxID=890382 RepID=F0WVN1_9STRA|nr:AlNc14C300G10368 [Albugo laibachii Nc14]|eukprot:CCA25475.1 AlNc14C300G10368 [Albugo laibachii Nc14]
MWVDKVDAMLEQVDGVGVEDIDKRAEQLYNIFLPICYIVEEVYPFQNDSVCYPINLGSRAVLVAAIKEANTTPCQRKHSMLA